MKRLITIILFAKIIFLFGCDDEFSPKGESEPKYAVFCILNADTNFQQTAVTRLYTVDGFDPYANETSPVVSGAQVKVTYQNTVFNFTETEVEVDPSEILLRPTSIYINNNFQPGGLDEELHLEVTMPDGKIITGNTRTPTRFDFDYGVSDRVLPVEGDTFFVYWYKLVRDNYYAPRLMINFFVEEGDSSFSQHSVEVPPHPYWRDRQNKARPSNDDHIGYRIQDFHNAMLSISEGDARKDRYYIESVRLEVLVFESDLAAYFATSNYEENQYIVVIDEIDYSNLSDELGVFGVFRKHGWNFTLLNEYYELLGYQKW